MKRNLEKARLHTERAKDLVRQAQLGFGSDWSCNEQVDVMNSDDGGKTWVNVKANPNLIVVIGPGAGTYQNAQVYDNLSEKGYEILKLADEKIDQYPSKLRSSNNTSRSC